MLAINAAEKVRYPCRMITATKRVPRVASKCWPRIRRYRSAPCRLYRVCLGLLPLAWDASSWRAVLAINLASGLLPKLQVPALRGARPFPQLAGAAKYPVFPL